MVLPEPVWSDDDIEVAEEVTGNPSSLISNTWSEDPTKLVIIRALGSCRARLGDGAARFGDNIVDGLAQKRVRFLHSYSLEVKEVHY